VIAVEGGRTGARKHHKLVEADDHETTLTPAISHRAPSEEARSARHHDHNLRWLMRKRMMITKFMIATGLLYIAR
jgi:hypothetical protein